MDSKAYTFLYTEFSKMTDTELLERANNAHKNAAAYKNLNADRLAQNEYNTIVIIDQIAMSSRPQISNETDRISRETYKLIA